MLSLTIKEGDYFMIGDNIRVQFLQDLSAKSIKIGIDAPKDLNIARNKPYENELSKDKEKNAARLKQIELQKSIQISIRENARQKENIKKQKKQIRKQSEESKTKLSV